MASVALAFAVLSISRSLALLSLVMAARMVPLMALMLVGGVFADRMRRQRLIFACDSVNGIVQLISAALLISGHAQIWQLVVLQAVGGTASAFVAPAFSALVPQVSPPEQRHRANALLGLGRDGARIGGAALGGLIVAAVGPGWGIACDGLSFLIGAALIGQLRLPAVELPKRSFLADLAEGWNDFRSRSWLVVLVVQFAFVNAFGMTALLVLGPVEAKRALGGAATWGAVLAAESAGLVVGGVLAMRFKPARPLLWMALSGLGLVPALVLLALEAPVWTVAAATFVSGVTATATIAGFMTVLQQEVPLERLSRVNAYTELCAIGPVPAGMIIVGLLGSLLGLSAVFAAAAVVIVVATVAALSIPDILRLHQAPAADTAAPAKAA
jgi:predicted MFS family arabinose efflux permease